MHILKALAEEDNVVSFFCFHVFIATLKDIDLVAQQLPALVCEEGAGRDAVDFVSSFDKPSCNSACSESDVEDRVDTGRKMRDQELRVVLLGLVQIDDINRQVRRPVPVMEVFEFKKISTANRTYLEADLARKVLLCFFHLCLLSNNSSVSDIRRPLLEVSPFTMQSVMLPNIL
jgi:hypothetical protein